MTFTAISVIDLLANYEALSIFFHWTTGKVHPSPRKRKDGRAEFDTFAICTDMLGFKLIEAVNLPGQRFVLYILLNLDAPKEGVMTLDEISK